MKKPESMQATVGLIIGAVGVMFLPFGILGMTGILQMEEGSEMSPFLFGLIFLVVGAGLFISGIICLVRSSAKKKEQRRILEEGMILHASVTRAGLNRQVQINGRNPYQIEYTYNYLGENYTGKSKLLWEAPSVREGDMVTIYVDTEKPEKSVMSM